MSVFLYCHIHDGQRDQRGGSHENWKSTKILISLTVLSQLYLKYAYMLDILIDQSSVEVRVLCQGGVRGGQVTSDWTRMQDVKWKAAI